MKLDKITKLEKRWYDDACGTALALELVGERWSLLIVRELMFGGRRFSDLRAALPGISGNVLTQRLERMERLGIVQRRTLPPPAPARIYELTPWGYEAEVLLRELGRWATRSPLHDPTLPLSPASIMMSFRTMYAPDRADGTPATIGFRFGAEGFLLGFSPGGIAVRRGEPEECDVVVETNPMSLASIVYGGRPIEDAEAAGEVTVTGDRRLFERLATWFPLPDKIV